jgi:tetratricopeptide (TPR) repeat protein
LSKKKYRKKARPTKNEQDLSEKASDLLYAQQPNKKFKYIFLLPILLTVAAGTYFIYSAFKSNGYFGFPLDDPWIHLTFAKNLIEYGSFSYYKNELITSGSTSPIYTLLLSLLYIAIKNEFMISYLLGVIFGALLVYMMTKLSLLQFKNFEMLALLTAMLIALQPKLNLINVSGMETSMFIFFIAASLYAYQSKKIVLLGIFMGLTIWCRPDGFVLWIAIAIDYFFRKTYLSKNVKVKSEEIIAHKKIITAFSIAVIFAAMYFLFNYLLSGSILPNTYTAKLEYYQNNNRTLFLENEVLKYFTEAEFILIWIPFLIYVLEIIRSFIKKENNTYLVYLLFIIGLIAVYYIKLPFAHRFGRYLMPVIPFYILIAIAGVNTIINFIYIKIFSRKSMLTNLIFVAYSISALALFIYQNTKSSDEFSDLCKYHNDRHVAAGKWLSKNTSESAVIATHDVGAIAFYGERKIIDMAGLITPELITHINDRLYSEYMNDYLAKHKVDYIVTLRNWFEVVNDKPVFVPVNEYEFLEIFKYDPARTHIQPREVSQINQAALQLLQNGSTSEALAYLHQSLRMDNKSSKTHFLLGAAYETIKDYQKAEKYFNNAVELYPNFADAYYGLAKINFDQNKWEESSLFVNRCLELNPDYLPAIQFRIKLDGLINK